MYAVSLFLLLCATTSFAIPTPSNVTHHATQLTTISPANKVITNAERTFWRLKNLERDLVNVPRDPSISIPVHFHIVVKDETPGGKQDWEASIQQQMGVLNSAFSSSAFRFDLVGTTYTINPQWFDEVDSNAQTDLEMKQALRQGGMETLNIFTAGFPSRGNTLGLGYTMPPASHTLEVGRIKDGVVINIGTLPGGSIPEYNMGMTLVHEVGHWGGLSHPEDGLCQSKNVPIYDVPAVEGPLTDCNNPPKVCQGLGYDFAQPPIYNIMNNSPHRCRKEFTPGQMTYFADQLRAFRNHG